MQQVLEHPQQDASPTATPEQNRRRPAPSFDPRVPFAATLAFAGVARPAFPLTRVVCELDGSTETKEAARAAIGFCRQHGIELELVGIVTADGFALAGPTRRPRNRSFDTVAAVLGDTVEAARAAGLTVRKPTIVTRRAT